MWNLMNLIVGWASGRFGLFGWIKPGVPKSDALNAVGLALAIISTFMFAFVESRPPQQRSEPGPPVSKSPDQSPDHDQDSLVVRAWLDWE